MRTAYSLAACLLLAAGCEKTSSETGTPAKTTTKPAKAAGSQPTKAAGSQPTKAAGSQPTKAAAAPAAASAPSVHFVFPNEGSKVFEDFDVVFGGSAIAVVPAGSPPAEAPLAGHHHLIVDGKHIPKGTAVPADATHVHFGKAQTSTRFKLTPGKHSLTMQFADSSHISFGAALSTTVNVEVVPNPATPPKVFFDGLADGAKLKSPATIKFGLSGMTVRPAGEDPNDKTSGHHHLIIDGKPTPIGQAVPADATHIHFGKGQTETQVELKPGEHTLTLQLADGAHRSYGPAMSATIKVTVE